jgi:hypothetical protein
MSPPAEGGEHEKEFLFSASVPRLPAEEVDMDVVYRCCCGIDVHKNSVTACVLWAEANGKNRQEKRLFGTFTQDLLALSDWLQACGVTHVAMESTGVYFALSSALIGRVQVPPALG